MKKWTFGTGFGGPVEFDATIWRSVVSVSSVPDKSCRVRERFADGCAQRSLVARSSRLSPDCNGGRIWGRWGAVMMEMALVTDGNTCKWDGRAVGRPKNNWSRPRKDRGPGSACGSPLPRHPMHRQDRSGRGDGPDRFETGTVVSPIN